MHKCSAHVYGVALVSGTTQCAKLGIYGIFTVLLPCFGELIASCNGNFSHFSSLCQEKYNEMPVIISCKASISVVFLEYGYKYFFLNVRERTCKHLTYKRELLKSCEEPHL